jgi:hypothetical protein
MSMPSGRAFQLVPVPGGGGQHIGPQLFGHGGGDLGDQVVGGGGQHRVAASGDPLGPQHGGLDLVGCQHQGRHVVSGLQHIADARLAADGRPLADQGGDVAINAAFGGLQLDRHGVGRDRLAVAAEDLDDLEKAFGASHGTTLLGRC